MNVEELVRDSLREQAVEQAPAGPGFADRVLTARRRRRTRTLASVAAATAAVVAIAVAVPLLDSGKDDVRPAGLLDGSGTSAHPDQSPPRDLIAAGNVALAAYYTAEVVAQTDDRGVNARTYWLLDQRTGRYEKDDRWSFVAVAPGMKTAAVLERELPAHRIGLLDLTTGKVQRWIPVVPGVGGLAFSRDGQKLVATTYGENPDLRKWVTSSDGEAAWMSSFGGQSSRTGFLVLDLAGGGGGMWNKVPAGRDINGREDFAFSRDGGLVYSRIVGERAGMQQYYELGGDAVDAPANERYLRWDVDARLSPDGTLAAGGLAKEVPDKSYSAIRDPRTGKEITKVRGGTLLAWVDDHRLIAWERTAGSELYRPQLVLVTIGSDRTVPLSGVREQNVDLSRQEWEPVFAER
ncbi:WD40 repeat domain-containing protein [Streptomyces sp. NBC_00038]|uniref:WD40 repeat domain-containing protein n=1 Tax=Streptomyces sp. NBC_00038 TaxID=2903615 RepID=UPI0022512448|nr:WD40 repeat domain-containing protein [Streptomyces sp. NBC_00038]MCX5556744.1 WD40 repeat domain-containing protein [Streptomyces sp. NBC_00038]